MGEHQNQLRSAFEMYTSGPVPGDYGSEGLRLDLDI